MSIETSMRDQLARAKICVYRVLGSTVLYSNRGQTAVMLYADQGAETKNIAPALTADAEVSERDFFVPRQTAFPPANGVAIGDEVTWNGVIYTIDRMTQDAIGSEHTLTCIRRQARRIK